MRATALVRGVLRAHGAYWRGMAWQWWWCWLCGVCVCGAAGLEVAHDAAEARRWRWKAMACGRWELGGSDIGEEKAAEDTEVDGGREKEEEVQHRVDRWPA